MLVRGTISTGWGANLAKLLFTRSSATCAPTMSGMAHVPIVHRLGTHPFATTVLALLSSEPSVMIACGPLLNPSA